MKLHVHPPAPSPIRAAEQTTSAPPAWDPEKSTHPVSPQRRVPGCDENKGD